MFEEHVAHDSTKANLELLCDIEVFISLTCIIPMFGCVQSLSKFAQTCDAFICDFVVVLKGCVGDLYCKYYNEQTRYGMKDFNQFFNTKNTVMMFCIMGGLLNPHMGLSMLVFVVLDVALICNIHITQ